MKLSTDTCRKAAVALFFGAYLLLGLSIFKDYGMSWDEYDCRMNGIVTSDYVVHGDQRLLSYERRNYGAIFDTTLIGIERLFGLTDWRPIFLMRHCCTFLLFYGAVVCFYFLALRMTRNAMLALIACVFLVASPRIFAHSFYNPKDIPFLAAFIFAVFSMVEFLDRRSFPWAVMHGIMSAIAIDVRILGSLVPVLTGAAFLVGCWRMRESCRLSRELAILAVYAVSALLFTVALWPYLWGDPVSRFVESFIGMSRFAWNGPVLYMGEVIKAKRLPWHYIPMWIAISTPVLYTALFLVGTWRLKGRMAGVFAEAEGSAGRRNAFLLLSWFFIPLGLVIGFRSTVYDSWRHLFFIYPAMILIAIEGLRWIWSLMSTALRPAASRVIKTVFAVMVTVNVLTMAYFMVESHPYQDLYFNRFAGPDMQTIKGKYELDYWGLSYRPALEYIAGSHKGRYPAIITSTNMAGEIAMLLLPAEDRDKLRFNDDIAKADYFIGNYRAHPGEYGFDNEVFSVKVGDAKIVVVHRIKDSGADR